MKCPSCGAAKLAHDTRDVPYTYKGDSTILRQVTGDFCPTCVTNPCWTHRNRVARWS